MGESEGGYEALWTQERDLMDLDLVDSELSDIQKDYADIVDDKAQE